MIIIIITERKRREVISYGSSVRQLLFRLRFLSLASYAIAGSKSYILLFDKLSVSIDRIE